MMFVFGLAVSVVLLAAGSAFGQSWKTSCSVDPGSIVRTGSSYVFKTSRNRCQGGIYDQRAEIRSSDISVARRSDQLFSATVSMTTASNEPFVIFQIHDGRDGCAPPMSLRWTSGNTLSFDSDYTMNRKMQGCVPNISLRHASYKGPRLKRDGTPHDLKVALQFDGNGGFDVNVSLDGEPAIAGKYEPSSDKRYFRSRKFYMKHGVYSRNLFEYELKSAGVKISQ